jgi:hypothetical protein
VIRITIPSIAVIAVVAVVNNVVAVIGVIYCSSAFLLFKWLD